MIVIAVVALVVVAGCTSGTLEESPGADSSPVLGDYADRVVLTMDATAVGGALESGVEVQLEFTAEYGATTTYWVNVQEDLSDEPVVEL